MCDPSTLYRAAWSRPTLARHVHGGLLTFPPRNRVSCAALALWPGIKAWVGPRVDTQHFTWYDDGTPAGTGPFQGARLHRLCAAPPDNRHCRPRSAPTPSCTHPCHHAVPLFPCRRTHAHPCHDLAPSLSHAAAPPAPWLPSRHSFTHTRLPYQDR